MTNNGFIFPPPVLVAAVDGFGFGENLWAA